MNFQILSPLCALSGSADRLRSNERRTRGRD